MDMEHRPHDSIFRAYFSDAGSMTELLHLALPSETFDRLNASSLQVEPDTYLDDEGSRHYADLAARVEIDKQEYSLYILFEHKSYYDEFAHLQILNYIVQTWLQDRMKAKPAGTAVPLRPVLPILFYHGPQRELPDRFSTAMLPPDLHPADLENQPDFSVHVFNLATLPDEKIQGSLELQAALFAMKYARRNFNLLLRKLNELAKNGGLLLIHSPRFRLIELYLLYTAGLTKEELKRKIESEVTDPVLQEDFMSTAQLLKMEGQQEGEIRKALKVARNLEGTMPLEEIARIVELPIEELRRLLQDDQRKND